MEHQSAKPAAQIHARRPVPLPFGAPAAPGAGKTVVVRLDPLSKAAIERILKDSHGIGLHAGRTPAAVAARHVE